MIAKLREKIRAERERRRHLARCVVCRRKVIVVPDVGMDPQWVADTVRLVCSPRCGYRSAD